MFEEICKKLDKQTNQTVEPVYVDVAAINTIAERIEDMIVEIKKPSEVEHHHRFTIDIQSNWFFFSWVVLVVIIFGSFWAIANQRQTISQYSDNDLKYRYIRMYGQTNENNLYRLEQQFKYADSINIVRKQVERYEELVKEQAEKLERAVQNSEEAKELHRQKESIKNAK
jgi:hypothetical protein